jgi:hypothetical protein
LHTKSSLALVVWHGFAGIYSISESPIQVEVTGRGVPKSRVYPSFGYETQQPREGLDGRFIQLMSFGWGGGGCSTEEYTPEVLTSTCP